MVLPALFGHLPAAGEIVLFDRSWYNRAVVERVMGFCTDEEYLEFMRTGAPVRAGAGRRRGAPGQVVVLGHPGRTTHAVHHPAVSTRCGSGSSARSTCVPGKWEGYTEAKEAMFCYTHTPARAVDGDQEQRQETRTDRGAALGPVYSGLSGRKIPMWSAHLTHSSSGHQPRCMSRANVLTSRAVSPFQPGDILAFAHPLPRRR